MGWQGQRVKRGVREILLVQSQGPFKGSGSESADTMH